MSSSQINAILSTLKNRSRNNLNNGGDGFISTDVLVFDVGLNTRTIRRELDRAVSDGQLERQRLVNGKSYKYRLRQ
ncbi:hypothetical protein KKJ06_16660 [Xenorhabdus bovienii]|uniref:hypothetical protein n=1 Tax=Xenorhabdus bovienii TaxID=40576 RepID=UPI0023B1C1EA|nr:hypothetical protein [Xenorhabdus bovienii]MDE9477052.1 hypothetical protein [Xenorhabdus bovienii]MDE9484397.1 hypothetical protein [Xenorhabdus bovienii]MDE9530031.1 hypothetical protein [Xenorhabdus bovienii]MDE9557012.1 hypothetical protein [Xenorhabdus bovienii]